LNSVHIHVGPGQLGLGLVVTTGIGASLPLHLVHPDPTRTARSPSMALIVCRDQIHDDEMPLDDKLLYCCGSSVGGLSESLNHALTSARHCLLTTSLGKAVLEKNFPLLLAMARARPRVDGCTTVFIPCENDPGKDPYERFAKQLKALDVDVRQTMVNRLCYWRDTDPERRMHERVVLADRFQEWVIAGKASTPVLEALDSLEHVRFVDDIEPVETRKRWLVNGTHLGLALVAARDRKVRLDRATAEPGKSEWLTRLQTMLIATLDERHPGLEGNEEYAAEHRAVWRGHRDRAGRVLSRLKRSALTDLFDDMERKLGDPARSYVGSAGLTPELRDVFGALHTVVLRHPNKFADFADLAAGKVTLSPEADAAATQAYAALMEGILPSDLVTLRVHQLDHVLATNRDVVTG
jgi:hypothetical protein